MNRPIVTVIIPVYNVESYLEKAVDSVISQTLTNWEMYLVDDGSTDQSGEICDRLAYADSRIHVLHQENQGAYAARNAAIDLAEGKYLFFMDADDWAIPEMLYEMVCLAEHYYLDAWAGRPIDNKGRRLSSFGQIRMKPAEMTAEMPEDQCAQLTIAGFYIETYYTDTDYYIQKQCVSSRVYGDKYEFREHAHELFDCNLLYTPWNKLYLASYIREHDIRFPGVHWDDFPFNLEVIRNVERVTVTDKAYYHFIRKREDSESEKYNENLYLEREAENQKLIGLYEGWDTQARLDFPGTQSLLTVLEHETEETAGEEPSAEDSDVSDAAGTQASADAEPSADEAETEAVISFRDSVLQEEDPSMQFPPPAAMEFLARRYLERIVGCVENVTNEQCTLTKKEKREEISKIISADPVRTALKTARPKSLHMKLMLVPIRMKSTGLTYLEGSLISRVKSRNGRLFARPKDNR